MTWADGRPAIGLQFGAMLAELRARLPRRGWKATAAETFSARFIAWAIVFALALFFLVKGLTFTYEIPTVRSDWGWSLPPGVTLTDVYGDPGSGSDGAGGTRPHD